MRIVSSSACIALSVGLASNEIYRLDMSSINSKEPPQPARVSFSPAPISMHVSPLVHPPELHMRFLRPRSEASQRKPRLDIWIENTSKAAIDLPVAGDGVAAYEACRGEPIIVSYLSVAKTMSDPGVPLPYTSLYGCKTLPRSLVRIKPSEWIALVDLGVSANSRSGSRPTLIYSVERHIYRKNGEELNVDIKGLFEVTSSEVL